MSYRVGCPEWVFSLPVKDGAKLLLVRLWGFVTGTEAMAFLHGEAPAPFVWPCRDRLADELGWTTRTIRRHLTDLETARAIRRDRRPIRGRTFDGYVLLDQPTTDAADTPEPGEVAPASADEGGQECPPDRTELSSPPPVKADRAVRQPGQDCPPDRTGLSASPDRAVPHTTPENTPEIKDHGKGDSAGRAIAAPPAEPLELQLDEPERLDPEALAAEVIGLSAEARKDLGARTRRTKPSKADRAAVLSLAEAGPVIELPDGVADMRTAPGLRRAWALVVRRKAEELRRRAEARGEDPAALARWLLVKTLARDAAELLDNDDLDQRKPAPPRGRARASPGQGPPVNNTDLARYADITDDLTRFENP